MVNGDKNKIKDVLQILNKIEKWEISDKSKDRKSKNHNDKDHLRSKGNRDKSKGTSNEQKYKVENPCKFPGHQCYSYTDCFDTPNSKNFKGTAKNARYYNVDGTKKKNNEEANQIEKNKKGTKCKVVS